MKLGQNGVLLMILSAFLFAAQAAFAKGASFHIPPAEAVGVRFFFGWASMIAALRWGWIRFERRPTRLLIARGIFGWLGTILYFTAISLTTIGNATLLCYTYPIFATLLGILFLRERSGAGTLSALAASFAGMVLIFGPTGTGMRLGEMVGLIGGACSGAAIVTVRELRRTEPAGSIFYYFNLVGMVLTLPLVLFHFVFPTAREALLLLGMAVSATGGQLLMTVAYRYVTAAEGSILSMLTVVLSAGLGVLLFSEKITWFYGAGALLILGSGIFLSVRQAILKRRESVHETG